MGVVKGVVLVSTRTSRVLSTESCGDFLTTRIQKPDDYHFSVGQWLRLTIATEEGSETRTLSHAAAPDDPSIEVGTRLSESAFKQAMSSLSVGDEVEVGPPGGTLSLPEPPSSAVLLAGGVGITPIRSLLRDAVHRRIDLKGAVLVYGNRDDQCIPYRDEESEWRSTGLAVVHVLERPGEGWTGERGFITPDVLSRTGPMHGRHFIVTGPPAMIAAMDAVLDGLAVPVADRRVESFGPAAHASVGDLHG